VLTLTTATNDFTGSVSASNSGANAMQLTDRQCDPAWDRHHGEQPHVNAVGITQNAGGLTSRDFDLQRRGRPDHADDRGEQLHRRVSLNNSGANNRRGNRRQRDCAGDPGVGTGTLTVNATGASTITQTGAITQAASAGAASFTTGSGVITLTQAGNNFTGAVSATNTAANVSITDANALALGTVSTGGNLALVSTGAITQSGPATATGTTSITAGAANDITLGEPAMCLPGRCESSTATT
jgi:hypothetical protein